MNEAGIYSLCATYKMSMPLALWIEKDEKSACFIAL